MPRLLALLLAVLLAGCGNLPRPFAGNPGANGRALMQPPPARLMIAPPTHAFLSEENGGVLARELVEFLVEREVPAIAGPLKPGVWSLEIGASLRDGKVTPTYTVFDTAGHEKGTAEGPPVELAQWAGARPETFRAAAMAATPRIADLLTRIEAERKRSDPTSLLNRPPRLFVPPVTGAPGDGQTSLTRQIRREFEKLGNTLVDTPATADFTVKGEVLVTPIEGKQERVEIHWIVTDAAGHERGKVVQLNEIPAGTLRGMWADVAVVIAQEAAPGVKDVMMK